MVGVSSVWRRRLPSLCANGAARVQGKKQEQICCGPLDENLRSCVRCWNGDNFQVLVAYDLCDTTAYSFSRLVINPSSLCLGGGGESSVVKGQGSDWFLGRAHPGSYLSTRPSSSRLVRCSDMLIGLLLARSQNIERK